MNDDDIAQRMHQLVAEEHALHDRMAEGMPTDEEHSRLAELEVQLDRCWDLLRQRRARRSAGQDPKSATARSAEVVERYQQ